MKKVLIVLGAAILSLTGLSITSASANGIPGVEGVFEQTYDKTVVEFCVRVDLTDDDVDNPTFNILRTKLVTESSILTVSVDEGALGLDLNGDEDLLDEFTAVYTQYENWLKTNGEGSSLVITDTVTGEAAVLTLGEYEISDFSSSHGLGLTDETCSPGPTGPAGANGTDGTNGVDGATGPAGPAGPAGQTVVVEKVVEVPVAAPVALPRTS